MCHKDENVVHFKDKYDILSQILYLFLDNKTQPTLAFSLSSIMFMKILFHMHCNYFMK